MTLERGKAFGDCHAPVGRSQGIASVEICKSVSLILQGSDNRHGEQSAGFAWPSRKNKTAELSRFIV